MKLMYAPASPFARKVRAASIELGLDGDIELVFTEVRPGAPNTAYGEAYNPLRKIPALALDDDSVIFDSTVICEYLDARAGNKLIPADGQGRWHVLTLHALANGMCECAVLTRYETFLRPAEQQWPTWIDDQWDKISSGLDWFETHGEELDVPVNLAQVTLGCLLGYLDFRFADNDWRPGRPMLSEWFAGFSQRPSLASTIPS